MNAQLRERLEAANKELIGAAKHHQSITDAIAALAAPKEAGDAEANIEYLQRVRKEDGAEAALDDAIDMLRRLAAPSKEAGDGPFAFDTLVAHGLANGANVVNGMPWSFKCMGLPVTHENDNHYLVNMPDGTTLNVYRRLAAPSKEAGPLDELTREQERLGLYAAPQADQQGASLEGEPPRGWGIAGNYGDGKWRCFREGKPQTYLGNPQATHADAIAECHRLAVLSKASPDDQRQEGCKHAWSIPDANGVSECLWCTAHSTFSPTASAAREG